MEIICLDLSGRIFEVLIKDCNFMQKIFGLMFSNKEKSRALKFSFNKPVNYALHSFFINYSFMVLWLGRENNILEIRKVRPWKFNIKSKIKFHSIIEIPINEFYTKRGLINGLLQKMRELDDKKK